MAKPKAKTKAPVKRKAGRPAYRPTDEERAMVQKLSGMGMTQDDICQLIINDQTGEPITDDTLRKHFSKEYASGRAISKMKVMRSAYQQAISGQVPAMTMFWLKTQCGWRETNNLEVTGKDGGPIEHSDVTWREKLRQEMNE